MSRHNRERRLLRKRLKKGLPLTPAEQVRTRRHGKRKLEGVRS